MKYVIDTKSLVKDNDIENIVVVETENYIN
jgi:hypothetical protein